MGIESGREGGRGRGGGRWREGGCLLAWYMHVVTVQL